MGTFEKIEKDLSRLISLTNEHIALGGHTGINGGVRPTPGQELIDEVRFLIGDRGLKYIQIYPDVRRKPHTYSGRYDSSQIHSDVWSANPAGYVVMFPISGDFENGGVEFFRPTKNLDRINQVYRDYRNVPDFGPEYIGKMEPGYMYVTDCLHRTIPGKERISVDTRLAFDNYGRRRRNYERF